MRQDWPRLKLQLLPSNPTAEIPVKTVFVALQQHEKGWLFVVYQNGKFFCV